MQISPRRVFARPYSYQGTLQDDLRPPTLVRLRPKDRDGNCMGHAARSGFYSGIVKSYTRPVAAPPAPLPAISPAVADCCPVAIKNAYSPGFRSELSASL